MDAKRKDLPQDRASLVAKVRSLILEREPESKRVKDLQAESLRQRKRADELHLENLRLQLQRERYKKWYYGPRADRLASSQDIAQALLEFAEQLDEKPIRPEDVASKAEPEYELRRLKLRPGQSASGQLRNASGHHPGSRTQRPGTNLPCCGVERKEMGSEQSWQIEYIPGRFGRIQHLRKKYACLNLDCPRALMCP